MECSMKRNPFLDLIEYNFDQITEAIESLTLSILEADIVFSNFERITYKMRMVELITLSDLLSKRSSRMMRKF